MGQLKQSVDPIRRWSTADVNPASRLDYYEAALAEAVLPIRIDKADPRTFRVEMSSAEIASLKVSKTFGSPHCASRGKSELARSNEHGFSLVMMLQSNWSIHHRGSMEFLPLDILVLDSSYPHTFAVRNPFTAINVGVSETWLRQWLPNLSLLSSRRIPGGSLWGRALSSYLSEMSPDLVAAPPIPLSVIADQVGSLLALTATGLRGEATAITPVVQSLLDRIQDCLIQRCTDWQLTAADVATSINISVRTLHRTLAAADRTFGGMLIDARAKVALRMLTSPAFRHVTTAEIGRRAGFPGASHFARVIRNRTGLTPLQLRRTIHSTNVDCDPV